MRIDDFIWLSDIIEKVAVKHHVTQDEAEDVFYNRPKYRFVEKGHRAGENIYSASGQTDSRTLSGSVFHIQAVCPHGSDSKRTRYGQKGEKKL